MSRSSSEPGQLGFVPGSSFPYEHREVPLDRPRSSSLPTAGRVRRADKGDRAAAPLVKLHSSLLVRELSEEEMHLQRNKVVNLRLAAREVDGLLIHPGETLSFNRVVGNCIRRKGYVGMRLSNGEAGAGVGGGICQLANLLH